MYARIDFAHHGELRQHGGSGIDIRAHVHHHHGSSLERGKGRGQRRTLHAANHSLDHLGGGHHRPGVARGDEALRLAVAHQARRHVDRGVLLGANHLGGRILHGDDFGGVADFNGQRIGAGMVRQFLADHVFLAHQDDAQAQLGRGANSSFDLRLRGVVAAHCVYRNCQHGSARGLFFDNFDDFAAFIFSAARAHAVRQLGFVAAGALGQNRAGQRIVSAAQVEVRRLE